MPDPDPTAVHHIPLAEIDADALTRDRTAQSPEITSKWTGHLKR